MEEPTKPIQETSGNASRVRGEENFINTTGLYFPYKYLSISQINKYLICPMSYYWDYVEKKREKPIPKMIIGSMGHKVLELMSSMDQVDFNENEIEEMFHNQFRDLGDQTPELLVGDARQELEDLKLGMIPSLSTYISNVFSKMKVVAQEVQINSNMPIFTKDISRQGNVCNRELGHMTFVGFIDFINYVGPDSADKEIKKIKSVMFNDLNLTGLEDKLEIGDYKTGGVKDHTFFQQDIQSPFYSQTTGINKIRIDNIPMARVKLKKDGSPYANNINPSCNILKYRVGADDIDIMTQQVSYAAVGIGSGVFPMCHPSIWKCSPAQCGHWSYCRGKNEGRFVTEVATEKFEDTKYAELLSKKSV